MKFQVFIERMGLNLKHFFHFFSKTDTLFLKEEIVHQSLKKELLPLRVTMIHHIGTC